MKVAITIWEDRISPVFDASRMLLIAEIENATIISKKHVTFNPEMPSYLIENLIGMDIAVLICGAVTEIPANMIEAGGIKLIPFVAGHVNEVLDSYAKNAAIRSVFLMPGCKRNNRDMHPGMGKVSKRKHKENRGRRKQMMQMGARGSFTRSDIEKDHQQE